MPSYAVVLADYDPQWPERYRAEAARIRAALGGWIEQIEHVGSTAVPGLAAKPIIDIAVGVRRLADAERCIEPLERIGYAYRPGAEVMVPDRRFFQKGGSVAREFHVHVVDVRGPDWERWLLFRDYLRAHPEKAREYERLKRTLASCHRDNRAYTAQKTAFIEAAVAEAGAAKARSEQAGSRIAPHGPTLEDRGRPPRRG